MEYTDNRVRYTKMVLQQALLRLLEKKNIDRITIKELCTEAQVNRGTFYLHYSTPNDILIEIEKQFIDENMTFFAPYIKEGYETSFMSDLFACVMKNKDITRIIMGKNGNPRFVERMQEMMRPSVIESWRQEFPDFDVRDLEYVYDFLFISSTRMLINWLEDDRGLSPEELATRLHCLGHACHLAIPSFHKEPPRQPERRSNP